MSFEAICHSDSDPGLPGGPTGHDLWSVRQRRFKQHNPRDGGTPEQEAAKRNSRAGSTAVAVGMAIQSLELNQGLDLASQYAHGLTYVLAGFGASRFMSATRCIPPHPLTAAVGMGLSFAAGMYGLTDARALSHANIAAEAEQYRMLLVAFILGFGAGQTLKEGEEKK